MSPLFCGVANRPSSDPVRREYAATSGVSGRIFSIARTWRSVSSSARAGRRQVVDDEPAFVGGGQEPGADR